MKYLYYHSKDPVQRGFKSLTQIKHVKKITVERLPCGTIDWVGNIVKAYKGKTKNRYGYIEREEMA